jgi:hypothetical protein
MCDGIGILYCSTTEKEEEKLRQEVRDEIILMYTRGDLRFEESADLFKLPTNIQKRYSELVQKE